MLGIVQNTLPALPHFIIPGPEWGSRHRGPRDLLKAPKWHKWHKPGSVIAE